MNVTEDKVRQAVSQVRSELKSELDNFQLLLFDDKVESSYGGWLVPAESRASVALRKSYDLHRLIEKIEDRIHDLTQATVTVDLRPAA